jgi:hypothetical protein
MKTNKKGKKLIDDVEKMWQQKKEQADNVNRNMHQFGEEAKGFINKLTGEGSRAWSTGQAEWDKLQYQKRKMKGFMENRGIFESSLKPTTAQIELKKKRDAKAKVQEAKRVEKRQRGSKTLRKRKEQVPEYLQKLEDLKKYKKGYKILFDYLKMNSDLLDDKNGGKPFRALLNKLHKLGLIK